MRALMIPAVALFVATAALGCDSDHDTIPDKVEQAAIAEASEAAPEGAEALVAAIRQALNEAPPSPLASPFTATNGLVLTEIAPDDFQVDGTVVVDRTDEGEAPIDATISGARVLRSGGPIPSGSVRMDTQAHVELGGGRGGHAHGGEAEPEEEPEPTLPITLVFGLPAPAGTQALLVYPSTGTLFVLEQDFPEVPPP